MNFAYLILTQAAPNDWAFREWKRNGIPSFMIFKDVNVVLRAVRRFWMKLSLPFMSIWLSKEWLETCRKSDVVIVHISCLTMSLPRYINRVNPKAKVIAWYWNIVNKASLPKKIKGECEIWSFDPDDCKKYGMKFNHQYYFKSLIRKSDQIEQDVFFCGSDSGRGEKLFSLYNEFNKIGLKTNFKIVYPQYEGIPEILKSKPVEYRELLEQNVKSKAILEIVRPGQVGATARLMEALFLRKKFITNNKSVKEEPFYNENNIFVLEERNLDELRMFIDKEFDHSVDEFVDEYDFSNWLNNFVQN